MKKIWYCSSVALGVFLMTTPCWAADSANHSGAAAGNLSQAAGASGAAMAHGAASAGSVVAGSVAVPLGLSGNAGVMSGQIAGDLNKAANSNIGTPLPISEETITVGPPPDAALSEKNKTKPQ